MANTWVCSDCESVNSVDRAVCACGNKRPADAAPSMLSSGHGGCLIVGCNMPGVFNDSLKGGDRWYCRFHYPYKGDFQHCARITEELKKNPPKLKGAKASGEHVGE